MAEEEFNRELQEIFKFSSVKDVVMASMASKTMNGRLRDRSFIKKHTAQRHLHQHHLIISDESEDKRVGFLDNAVVEGRYPSRIPVPVRQSSFGLVGGLKGGEFLICNPSLRKRLSVPLAAKVRRGESITLCVSPDDLNPKILGIVLGNSGKKAFAHLYRVDTGGWRRFRVNLPGRINVIWVFPAVTDAATYWMGEITNKKDYPVIVSFHHTTELFSLIEIPPMLGYLPYKSTYGLRNVNVYAHNFKGGLGVVVRRDNTRTVWAREDNSFRRLFVVEGNEPLVAFTKNGAPVTMAKVGDEDDVKTQLTVHEAGLTRRNGLGLHSGDDCYVVCYEETLLLFDRTDTSGY